MADLLANIEINPIDITFASLSKVKTGARPSILDNILKWQVFEDDQDILRFMNCEDKYHGQELDCLALVEIVEGKEVVLGNEFIQLKINKVPRALVVLETMFDNQERVQMDTKKRGQMALEEVNLGTRETPKNVYIGKKMSQQVRKSLIELLRRFRHVFAWSYDDLKV